MKSTAINMSQMNLKALKELRHFQGSLIQNFLGEDIAGHPFFLPPSAVVCAPPPLPNSKFCSVVPALYILMLLRNQNYHIYNGLNT